MVSCAHCNNSEENSLPEGENGKHKVSYILIWSATFLPGVHLFEFPGVVQRKRGAPATKRRIKKKEKKGRNGHNTA